MAIRITEDGVVIYENEPDIDRELFPNTPEGGGSPEQIAQAVADWFEDHPMVQDVQLNGISIVADGVANVPKGGYNTFGVVTYDNQFGNNGIVIVDGAIRTSPAAIRENIKTSTNGYKPITSVTQHASTFYGLAKAAGDTTQALSDNPVGSYTEDAKSAIQDMLGISNLIGSAEGSTASTSYSIGDVFLHSGALYKATAAIASGDAIVPGTNCEQTTIIDILKGA